MPPIALITPAFWPDRGGVAAATARLADGLAASLTLEVIVLQRGQERRIQVTQRGGYPLLRVQGENWSMAAQLAFGLLRERSPYRLVHAVYPSTTGFLAVQFARYSQIPALLAARGNDLLRDSFLPERQAALALALSRADAVVGVSTELCQMARALGAQHTRWIANGVDPALFSPLPRPYALSETLGLIDAYPVVGFVGEARAKKGLSAMLQAVVLLAKRWPSLKLLLVGGVRLDDRPLLTAWRQQHPALARSVISTPWISERRALANYYALLDLVWHPALSDGFPNAVLEALSCRQMVIASAVGGSSDLYSDSELARWLLGTPTAEALAAHTTRWLNQPSEVREAQREQARLLALRFDANCEVAAYRAQYEALTVNG